MWTWYEAYYSGFSLIFATDMIIKCNLLKRLWSILSLNNIGYSVVESGWVGVVTPTHPLYFPPFLAHQPHPFWTEKVWTWTPPPPWKYSGSNALIIISWCERMILMSFLLVHVQLTDQILNKLIEIKASCGQVGLPRHLALLH